MKKWFLTLPAPTVVWARRYVEHALEKVWILQLPASATLVLVFVWLWDALRADGHAASIYIEYPKILLPVLAVTNAIPMLAAGSYLSRFNASSKSRDALAQIYEIIHKNEGILGSHPRYNRYQKFRPIRSAARRIGLKSLSFAAPKGEMWFTPRPLWDGIWYYGEGGQANPQYDRSRKTFHEVVYCAVAMLTLVRRMQRGPALLRKGRPMAQGSKWFLETFHEMDPPDLRRLRDLTEADALNIIRLAQRSVFYMNDEVQTYQHMLSRDEHREADFSITMCEYLIWNLYFSLKLLEIRVACLIEYGRDTAPLEKNGSDQYKKISELRETLLGLRGEMIPHRVVTQRVMDVRSGTIVPIVLSAAALLCCIALLPLAQADSGADASQVVDWFGGVTYALGTAAITGNILFGIWLLWPPKFGMEATLVPR